MLWGSKSLAASMKQGEFFSFPHTVDVGRRKCASSHNYCYGHSQFTCTTRMASGSDLRAESEAQGKALQEHLTLTESNFAAVMQDFAAISRKTGKLRDKTDALARTLNDFSTTEGPSVKSALSGCAECFSGLEDYRETLIARLQSKVIQPLTEYGNVCKKAKEELRLRKNVLERELAKQRNLDRVTTREPADTTKKVLQARQEVSKARAESVRAQKAFEDHMINFEKKKIRDLRMALSEYIQAHMTFHGKALELYTVAFQNVLSIDAPGDLMHFRQRMNIKTDGGDATTDGEEDQQRSRHLSEEQPSRMQNDEDDSASNDEVEDM
ncbi:CBY1-interacting BAR domain-containing protein 1-like [Oscarella lobularis]|uniref:CBY1-interacting BAR domain-containing protein 1-like n=1 Tax=Oscarella lobularis TaxID=121494 RepID=UPI00331373B6